MKIKIDAEVKKVLGRLKAARSQFEQLVQTQGWLDEARKFAQKQRGEVKKLIGDDLNRVRSFIERERKNLNSLQKKLPAEVARVRKFVSVQRKDLEKMLKGLKKANKSKKSSPKKSSSKRAQSAKS